MLARRLRLLFLATLAVAVSAPAADAPVPADDPRDISGVWLGLTGPAYRPNFEPLDGSEAPLLPPALAQYRRRIAAYARGQPIPDTPSRCLPHGVPRSMLTPYPMHILQTPGQVTIVHESGHNVRLIYLDEKQERNPAPTFMGHSVGRWEGDTLVVDTVGLDARTWLDEAGKPHSEALHVIERLRKLGDGRLEDVIMLDDPESFAHAWTTRRVYDRRPDLRLLEYICEENDRDIEQESEAPR